MNLLAVDLGGTAVKYGLFENGVLNHPGSFPTPSTYAKLKTTLLNLYGHMEKITPLSGLAMSVPGAVDTKYGVIYGISAIPYLSGFEIQKDLEETLKIQVTLENDANCAALSEMHFGSGRGIKNAVVMVIGSGIGGALIIDGKLVKGLDFFGGELGYMLIQDSPVILSELSSPIHGAFEYSKEKGLVQPINGKELFSRADQGDEIALKFVERIHYSLAKSIYNLMVILNPECFLIGGAISARPQLVPELMVQTTAILSQQGISHLKPHIRSCTFLSHANLMGAAAHFLESQPKK